MNLMFELEPQPASRGLSYEDTVLMVGSCFSDNIGSKLAEAKFRVLHNPTGIVFDPISLGRHLKDYAASNQYNKRDLVLQGELWHSWYHHSDCSSTSQEQTLTSINTKIIAANQHLQSASFLFITLGTAYTYKHIESNRDVANCHKVAKDQFSKRLLTAADIVNSLTEAIQAVRNVNPEIHITVTVSPVKHVRDGIIENNRSKARLIEAAHQLCATNAQCSYFPAFELVNDVLRDYRFYAPDMAHPNEQSIQFVFEHFCKTYLQKQTQELMQEVMQVITAKQHRPLHPNTQAHQQFMKTFLAKTLALQQNVPCLNWDEEIAYFSKQAEQ